MCAGRRVLAGRALARARRGRPQLMCDSLDGTDYVRHLEGIVIRPPTLLFLAATLGCEQATDARLCALPFTFPAAATEARIVMLGDLHGTHETPQLAAELACALARSGTPVTLAIEMPHDEQVALNAYLASDGGDAARGALIARPFWQLRRDGTASVATLEMIDRIRALRQRGAQLSILAIDASRSDLARPPTNTITPEQEQSVRAWVMKEMGSEGAQSEGAQVVSEILAMLPELLLRDSAMAQHMADAMRTDRSRRFVVLAGNAHTGKLADEPFPGQRSMASILAPQFESLLSLNTAAMSGAWWGCAHDCGLHEVDDLLPLGLRDELARRGPGVHMGYTVGQAQDAYDGTVIFERATAAEPAASAAWP